MRFILAMVFCISAPGWAADKTKKSCHAKRTLERYYAFRSCAAGEHYHCALFQELSSPNYDGKTFFDIRAYKTGEYVSFEDRFGRKRIAQVQGTAKGPHMAGGLPVVYSPFDGSITAVVDKNRGSKVSRQEYE